MGSYEVDCSGFLNNILITEQLVDPLLEVQSFLDSQKDLPRPNNLDPWPIHYVSFLSARKPMKHWRAVDAKLLQPGDVIAYSSYKREKLSSEHGQHIMIVADTVRFDQKSSCVWVPIFDSTKIPHGNSDIRENGNGIGQGTIGLELDENGSPTRIQWSQESKYKLRRRITMARVIE